jgi:hypothetical protein
MRTLTFMIITLFLTALATEQTAWARGGGGGGGRGGGGGGRGGGGMSRPSGGGGRGGGSMSRPSGGGGMSRPSGGASRPGGGFSGGVSRPSGGVSRPSGGYSGGASRPSGGYSGGASRPSTGVSRPSTPTAGTRPTAGQLNNFLGLPGDVGGARPAQLPAQPGGGRPNIGSGAGQGGRPSQLPAQPGGGRPGIGDGNRPGSGTGPGRPGGGTQPGWRPGGGGGTPGGRPQPPQGNRPNRGDWQQNHNNWNIQNNFNGYGYYHGCCPYTRTWWNTYPGAAWTLYGVTLGAFALSSFATIASFFDDPVVVAQDPIPYNYGTTIYYEGDTVYVNDQPAGTTEQYYDQASDIAAAGTENEAVQAEDWMPLGVFAIVGPNDTNATLTVQLTVNKQGVIRGNQFDMATGENAIVKGSVDKKTQKVAWTAGQDTSIVYETGLANLTEEQSTVLVHYGKDTSEVYNLVHINEPPADDAGGQQ